MNFERQFLQKKEVSVKAKPSEKLKTLERLFGSKHPIIGAVHFSPLPGYEGFTTLDALYERAKKDTKALEQGGADGIIFENNYDIPHKTIDVGQETEQAMTALIKQLREETILPIGISVLFNDYRTALRIAKEVDADFIRVPVFVDHVMTNYGEVIGTPEDVIAYRRKIGADNVLLFTDIHVKHSQILSPETIEQSAQNAINAGSDGLIITGKWTGDAPDKEELERVRQAVGNFPILLGSGVDAQNISSLFQVANGAIVSTSLKEGHAVEGEVNVKAYDQRIVEEKVAALVDAKDQTPQFLFICSANVGRSQIAEAFANQMAGKKVAASAGVESKSRKYHGYPTAEIVKVLQEVGIDGSCQKVKQIRPQMLEKVAASGGKIIVLCDKEEIPDYLLERFGNAMSFYFITDPYHAGIDGAREVREQIKQVVEQVIAERKSV